MSQTGANLILFPFPFIPAGTLVDWYAGRFAHLAKPLVKKCADLLIGKLLEKYG